MEVITTLLEILSQKGLEAKIRPPPNCPNFRLSEVFSSKKGIVPKDLSPIFNKSALPYINIKAFEQEIVEYYAKPGDGVSVNEDDLVIVWDGARCGLVGQGQNGILGSTLKKLSLRKSFTHVPLSYMKFFLQSQYRYINGHSRGSVIQHIDPDLFWKLEVPIPEKDDERFQRITTLLQAMDGIEEQTEKQLNLVRNMRDSLLKLSFG